MKHFLTFVLNLYKQKKERKKRGFNNFAPKIFYRKAKLLDYHKV